MRRCRKKGNPASRLEPCIEEAKRQQGKHSTAPVTWITPGFQTSNNSAKVYVSAQVSGHWSTGGLFPCFSRFACLYSPRISKHSTASNLKSDIGLSWARHITCCVSTDVQAYRVRFPHPSKTYATCTLSKNDSASCVGGGGERLSQILRLLCVEAPVSQSVARLPIPRNPAH